MFKKTVLAVGLIVLFFGVTYAEESITVTTYYPSPMGSYNDLEVRNRIRIKGDVDGDGQITANDASMVAETTVGINVKDIYGETPLIWVMDLNNDGIASIGDASRIETMIAKGRRTTNIAKFYNVGTATTGGVVSIEAASATAVALNIINGTALKPGAGAWGDSSDKRLKKNIHQLSGALDKLALLKPVAYEWINPAEHASLPSQVMAGFVAQDVEEVFPSWVGETEANGVDKDLVKKDEKVKTLTLPNDFSAYVIKALQELKAENDNFKNEIADLKKEISAKK